MDQYRYTSRPNHVKPLLCKRSIALECARADRIKVTQVFAFGRLIPESCLGMLKVMSRASQCDFCPIACYVVYRWSDGIQTDTHTINQPTRFLAYLALSCGAHGDSFVLHFFSCASSIAIDAAHSSANANTRSRKPEH